ncbi:MAG: hypothetical protein AB4352_24155 [Hormoscilla sp.]
MIDKDEALSRSIETVLWTIASSAMVLFAVKRDDRLWEGGVVICADWK